MIGNGNGNGTHPVQPLARAAEVDHHCSKLIDAVKALVVPFIRAADEAAPLKALGTTSNVLVTSRRPEELVKQLAFSLPEGQGRGENGLLETIQNVLAYSVNTWDQGFMDKLYASTNAVGVVSELLLGVLNTNLHVYQVSPALSIIEKHTARTFANLFGFNGPRAGGVTCQGGSASNLTSVVIARNTLYPASKMEGNACASTGPFVLFTSEHGHYSVEKAAVTCGFGSAAVWTVPVDDEGRMSPSALRERILAARAQGRTPLYVNATAGTTVFGSYDPFEAIAAVCKEFNLWLHIDASWGGPAIFSARHRAKLAGAHLANSLTVNPHKMMNVPVTCSFLLTSDTSVFHRANTLPAGYLFHGSDPEPTANRSAPASSEPAEVWDLADLTLQCGRRGDALKLALSWIYYGAAGFESQIDNAFETAAYLATTVSQRPNFVLISADPPPCLQVCFYYAPGGKVDDNAEENTRRTRIMAGRLVEMGFMVDYAPGDKGSFFRVVVNCQTLRGTVDGLVDALEAVGRETVGEVNGKCANGA
ncbi:pyridoxal phosphate-dependent transferase [Immersiella caudata]|uniref:Pyridoxal phosphate-dependent transferase n=1 Tax=Immersiella caudata TaxID=314043 RepID=A0AA39THM8_9PEZI|nr:pyridoxal phosphate-dependent transferase [Immersiella caudata]